MKVVPIPYDSRLPVEEQKRFFYIVTKRNGILIAAPMTEQEHLGLDSLINLFSHLPHRGGITPVFSHSIPMTPVKEYDQTI